MWAMDMVATSQSPKKKNGEKGSFSTTQLPHWMNQVGLACYLLCFGRWKVHSCSRSSVLILMPSATLRICNHFVQFCLCPFVLHPSCSARRSLHSSLMSNLHRSVHFVPSSSGCCLHIYSTHVKRYECCR